VAVFPEYIGTFLLTIDEKESIYNRNCTFQRAIFIMIISNFFSFLFYFPSALFYSSYGSIIPYMLFRMKAKKMVSIYHRVFSTLALKYNITIVAGSILLPSPKIAEGKLQIQSGPLYNISVVYNSNGTPNSTTTLKCNGFPSEVTFTGMASPDSLKTITLDNISDKTKLGVLISNDSWFPQIYSNLKAQQVSYIVVPAFIPQDFVWGKTWYGYLGGNPKDVNVTADIGQITVEEAWIKYALPSRMRTAGVNYGLVVFLRGLLWDIGSDGCSMICDGNTVFKANQELNDIFGALINLWLQ